LFTQTIVLNLEGTIASQLEGPGESESESWKSCYVIIWRSFGAIGFKTTI
jgi:hypothetical protein